MEFYLSFLGVVTRLVSSLSRRRVRNGGRRKRRRQITNLLLSLPPLFLFPPWVRKTHFRLQVTRKKRRERKGLTHPKDKRKEPSWQVGYKTLFVPALSREFANNSCNKWGPAQPARTGESVLFFFFWSPVMKYVVTVAAQRWVSGWLDQPTAQPPTGLHPSFFASPYDGR